MPISSKNFGIFFLQLKGPKSPIFSYFVIKWEVVPVFFWAKLARGLNANWPFGVQIETTTAGKAIESWRFYGVIEPPFCA